MKEFEKWDVGNKINYATISSGELDVQHERCKAWKAALEWVLNTCVLTAIGDFDIKQELQE